METKTLARFDLTSESHYSANGVSLPAHNSWSALRIPPRDFPAATSLFFQGDTAREAFYIERGLIKLIHLSGDGQELIIGLRSQGSFLGSSSVIVHEPHPVTAITVT